MTDVGIVGAGPAGLFAANVLVRAGIDCVVLERLAEDAVRARARAGLIEDRTAVLLERHGLADGMLRRGKTLGACEFRRAGRRYVFDYASLSGACHRVYPQQLLVADLVDSLRSAGGEVRFVAPVGSVRLAGRPVIVTADGQELPCGFVLGCDGFHGVARVAAAGTASCGTGFGAEWLTILAEAPPSSEYQVYGLHPEGFVGHMHRTPAVSASTSRSRRARTPKRGRTMTSGGSSRPAWPPAGKSWSGVRSSTSRCWSCAAASPSRCRPGACTWPETPPTS